MGLGNRILYRVGLANQRFGRKAKICSAESEPVRKPSVCSPTRVYDPRLSAHPAPQNREK